MRKICPNEIRNYIKQNKINYVSYSITNWQLVGAKATLLYLNQIEGSVNPLFIIDPHKESGYLVDGDSDVELYHRSIIEKVNKWQYLLFIIRCFFPHSKDGTLIYFANAWSINFKRVFQTIPSGKYRIKFIIFEEGASNYRIEAGHWYTYIGVWNPFQLFNKFISTVLENTFKRRGDVVYLTPFRREGKNIVKNYKAIELYKQVLKIKPIKTYDNLILMVMGALQPDEIRLAILVKKIAKELGVKLLIKDHPRYPLDGYGLDDNRLLDRRGVESILPIYRPKFVISFWSTTLLTANYLYGIKTISLFKFMDRNNVDAEEYKHCEWFYNTFNNIVLYPQKEGELKNILVR